MARPKIKARNTAGVPLREDNAQPLGTPAKTALTEPGQDAEASDYPASPSRTKAKGSGGRKGSAGIITKGKGK